MKFGPRSTGGKLPTRGRAGAITSGAGVRADAGSPHVPLESSHGSTYLDHVCGRFGRGRRSSLTQLGARRRGRWPAASRHSKELSKNNAVFSSNGSRNLL